MPYHTKSTDAELRQGCIQQDRLAQELLYRRHFGWLLSVSMRYTHNRDEATDILNLAFLKIFNSMTQFQDTGSFKGWMAKIVFHTAIDHIRQHTSYKKHHDYSGEIADQSVENSGLDHLQAEDLYHLIQHITPASRNVFSLYVIDGYNHPEIADMLGISVGTSKWHLANARYEMKKMMEQYYQPNL